MSTMDKSSLKKYLDKYKEKTKKPKRFVGTGLKIVDTDSSLAPGYTNKKSSDKHLIDEDDGPNERMDDPEEMPQIVAVVDERPNEIKLLEEFRKTHKWKTVVSEALDLDSHKNSTSPNAKNMRKSHANSDSDASPPRRRNDSDSDNSPPRKNDSKRRKRNSDSDVSPPRRREGRQASDSDPSPPRRDRNTRREMSPSRGGRRHNNNSPPSRQSHRRDSDTSPPRRPQGRRKDSSPPPRQNRRDSSSDVSPPRRPQERSRDRHDDHSRGGNRRRRQESESPPPTHKEKHTKTLEGKKAGLQTAGALRDELQVFQRQENERFQQMEDSVTGRYAKTKVRDRQTGRERDLAAENEEKMEENRKAAERKKQYDKWGKGIKQVEEQQERVSSALHEMAKPLARYKDDEDLDAHLRQVEREGDPMLKFLSKKKGPSRFGGPAKPAYNGPTPPPNRFNIAPGYRWDGVDRSIGYEKQWFERQNSRKALLEESYKWSVEDL